MPKVEDFAERLAGLTDRELAQLPKWEASTAAALDGAITACTVEVARILGDDSDADQVTMEVALPALARDLQAEEDADALATCPSLRTAAVGGSTMTAAMKAALAI